MVTTRAAKLNKSVASTIVTTATKCTASKLKYNHEYYRKNKEAIREKARERRQRTKEHIKTYSRQYHDKNKERIKAYTRQRYDKNKERLKAKQRAYYASHRDAILEKKRAYMRSKKNREAACLKSRRYRERHGYYKNRVCTTPHLMLRLIKQGAKCRNLEVMIDDAEIMDMMGRPCFYCGFLDSGVLNRLDRLDSAVAYTPNNCVPCCSACNYMKSTADPITFVERCAHVSWHNGGPGEPSTSCWTTRKKKFEFAQMKRKNKDVTISRGCAMRLVMNACTYCGRAPQENSTHGIDRVDASRGYVDGNCVSACLNCNIAKNTLSADDFIQKCKIIASRKLVILSRIPMNIPRNVSYLRSRSLAHSDDTHTHTPATPTSWLGKIRAWCTNLFNT